MHKKLRGNFYVHTLIFDEEAIKFLHTLPKDISKRIFNKIQDTKENPSSFHKVNKQTRI